MFIIIDVDYNDDVDNGYDWPHAQTSTGLPYGSLRNTSGDR